MKKFALIICLFVTFQTQAASISGRQFDFFISRSEYQVVQTIYFKWTRSWGGKPKAETASTMLHMMLGVGRGFRLTPAELSALNTIDSQVINRANLVSQSIKSKIR